MRMIHGNKNIQDQRMGWITIMCTFFQLCWNFSSLQHTVSVEDMVTYNRDNRYMNALNYCTTVQQTHVLLCNTHYKQTDRQTDCGNSFVYWRQSSVTDMSLQCWDTPVIYSQPQMARVGSNLIRDFTADIFCEIGRRPRKTHSFGKSRDFPWISSNFVLL